MADWTTRHDDGRRPTLRRDASTRGRRARERAAGMFRALGDPARLELLTILAHGEACVTDLSETLQEGISTISQRLRLLRTERIVVQRREGKRVYYSLADRHVAELIANAMEHAGETGR